MSDLWSKFVAALVEAWRWAHDWYALVVIGAALIGVVVIIIEVRQLAKERRNG